MQDSASKDPGVLCTPGEGNETLHGVQALPQQENEGIPRVLPTPVLHHYVIVRRDLPVGVKIAQTIHAAGESSPGNLPNTTHAVALEAPDETDLIRLERELLAFGIQHVSIREPDAPYNNQLMAIGIVPCVRSKILRKLTSRFALVR